jgi:AraC family transcriptional regulator
MQPVQKALWFIESHFADDISLDDIALAGGVSRFHMSRAFGEATGRSISGYLRGRRLTESARALSKGAADILSVALEAGYGSHEAFTRAFRDQFGMTPEQVRAQGHVDNLALVEAIRMTKETGGKVAAPRFEERKAMLAAGIGRRYRFETTAGIPAQWQEFNQHFGHVPGQVGDVAYGVCCNFDDAGNFDYVCAAEVSDFSDQPEDFSRVRIPAARYAVFSHDGHVSLLPHTVMAIWNEMLPGLKIEVADAPNFERYGPEFDPDTGEGGVEIWIPVRG